MNTAGKITAVLATAMLLVAGCTSGDDDEDVGVGTTDGSGSSGSPENLEGPAPGVTDDAIKVGFTWPDVASLNIATLNHGDYQATFQAVVDDINERGGINGRRIEPVFAPVNPVGTAPAEQACLELTEDQEVFAVVGSNISASVLPCYLELHQTAVIGGQMSPELLDRARAPWFSTEASSDLSADVVRRMAEEGELDEDFAVFALAAEEAILDDVIAPVLDEVGKDPVDRAVLDAVPTDVAANVAQTQVIAQRFDSAGATRVLVLGNGGSPWLQGIEDTDYRPTNLFVTTGSVLAYANDQAGRDLSTLDGAIAGDLYLSAAALAFDEPKMQDCIEVIEAAGAGTVNDPDTRRPDQPNSFVSAFTACRTLALFEAIASEAGENLNYATFQAAGESLGEVELPADPSPYHYGPPPSRDGDPEVYLFEWDPDSTRFVLP